MSIDPNGALHNGDRLEYGTKGTSKFADQDIANMLSNVVEKGATLSLPGEEQLG
jgi:hypothetical protein